MFSNFNTNTKRFIPLFFLSMLLFLQPAISQVVSESEGGNDMPAISQVSADMVNGEVHIYGRNLGGLEQLRLTLGDIQLVLIGVYASGIDAYLPVGIAPGDYRLTIYSTKGKSKDEDDEFKSRQFASYDLTLGATGPQGPTGLQGPTGATGPQGLQGIPGTSAWLDEAGQSTTLGKVGIGTLNPTEQLDVEGNIHASGTIRSGNSIIIDGINDTITSSSGAIGFDNENLSTMGKLGIGTSTPTSELEVVGTAKATAFVGDGSGLTNIPAGPLGTSIESSEITNGEIVNADISPTAAITASKIADGSGSGLDADLLDGQDSTDFAASGHDHDGAEVTTGIVAEPRIDAAIARDTEVSDSVATHKSDAAAHHVKTTSFTELSDSIDDAQIPDAITRDSELGAHTADTTNPHVVTAAQAGATTPADVDATVATHTGDAAAHHTKTNSFTELSDSIADGQIPTEIARDTEVSNAVTTHTGDAAAHHTKTTTFTELSDVIADGQIPTEITRDTELATHTTDTTNPHVVTAAQAGATTPADVDATIATHTGDAAAHHIKTTSFTELSDSIADGQIPGEITRDTELATHTTDLTNPHDVTAAQVELQRPPKLTLRLPRTRILQMPITPRPRPLPN